MIGIILASAFLLGFILRDSGAGVALAVPFAFGGLVAVLIVRRRAHRVVVLAALALLALGAWRAEAEPTTPARIVISTTDSDQSIDATIVGVPRRETTRTATTIRINSAAWSSIAVSLPLFPEAHSGDVIRFWAPKEWDTTVPGQVEVPIPAKNGNLFIPAFEVERESTARSDRWRNGFNAFLTSSIEEHVPEPAGSLTLGIMNGDDSGMTDSTRTAFRLAGMSQITAVSGWNVALVAGFIAILTARLARSNPVTLIASVCLVWMYAFAVGMAPSVERAAGMATVFLIARWRGRPGDLLTSFLVTLALLVALTPAIRFDVGFQLSVVATLGIVLFLEQGSRLSAWQSSLALPFVAEIAVAPLVLHHFGTYSLLSPLANLVTGPLVELVMAGGTATAIASLIHPELGDLAGIVTWVPARLIIAVAEHASNLGATSGTTVTIGWTSTFVAYLVLLCAYLGYAYRTVIRRLISRAARQSGAI